MQYKVQSLIAIFLHRLIGTPFATFSEYPPMCQPLEIGANMPEHLIRQAYRDHNKDVIVSCKPNGRSIIYGPPINKYFRIRFLKNSSWFGI